MRTTNGRLRTVVAAAMAVGALAMGGGAAHADSGSYPNTSDDNSNITRVRVNHGDNLKVTVKHQVVNYNPRMVHAEKLFIDKNSKRPGPELMVKVNLLKDGAYTVRPMKNWKAAGVAKKCAGTRAVIDQDKATVTYTLKRSCMGKAKQTRVGAQFIGMDYDHNRLYYDWFKKRRAFTPWVERG